MVTLLQPVQQVQESLLREGASASEVIERPVSEGFQNTSNLNKVRFSQQSPNVPSGMPSIEVEKVSKPPKMVDLASTGLRISTRLSNKPRQKYSLFDKLSLELIGACEVANNPHIFLTRSNQHIQVINRNFGGTLNHYGPMGFQQIKNKINLTYLRTCCCNQTS